MLQAGMGEHVIFCRYSFLVSGARFPDSDASESLRPENQEKHIDLKSVKELCIYVQDAQCKREDICGQKVLLSNW